MFKNYLKIAWRNLWKNKTFSMINILGLAVAFGAAILLTMAALFDLSYDDFHDKGNRIYKVYEQEQVPEGQEAGTSMPNPFAAALEKEVPGVEHITRYLQQDALAIDGDKEIPLKTIWVDDDFFSIFTTRVKSGSTSHPLKEIASVVLTSEGAKKLFNTTDVAGRSFNIQISGKEIPFTVASVVDDFPNNTSINFEMALRFENNADYTNFGDSWNSQYHNVYILLQKGLSPEAFSKNTKDFVSLHYSEVIAKLKRDGAQPNTNGNYLEFKLLPLENLHFTTFKNGYAQVIKTVPYLTLAIALLILFIACVNFVNMSVAKNAQRLKEIGMRKTLGARPKQLFSQFWGESILIFMAAIGLGAILATLFLSSFKTIFNTETDFEVLLSPYTLLCILGLLALITFLVGGYPALLLSRMSTVQSLKGRLQAQGKNYLRDALIMLQFGIAILLITGTLVLHGQIQYMRNKDLGFDKDAVISFFINGKKNGHVALKLLKEELKGNPNILSVSGSDSNLGRGHDDHQYSSKIGFEYKGHRVTTNFLAIDADYVKTLGLHLVAGRDFRDNTDSLGVLINQAMARQLEEDDPLSLQLPISGDGDYPVIGVLEDYNFQEISSGIEPIIFVVSENLDLSYAYVKVAPTALADGYTAVEKAWKQIEPNATFLGSFLDENIDRTFRREKSMATMVASGSVLAIILSAIGLFAMATLIVTQRTKEIGIRKVVGGSVRSIIYLLTRGFLKLVFWAFLIVSPFAWWLLSSWLENYAYRIHLNVLYFMGALGITLIVAVLTVGIRTFGAAMANPVKALRNE